MQVHLQQVEVQHPATQKRLFHIDDLTVPMGKSLLIQGESGRGKTTLLHLIAGLFYPAAGEVTVGDQRLTALNDEERCRFRRQNIGLVFQKLNLLEHLSALENVLLAGLEVDTGKALAALRQVGLEHVGSTRSSKLSLGEQQRVAVARVLAGQNQLILADEPTSSLDQKNSAQVMDLLFTAARGKTLIVVSHDYRLEQKFDQKLDFAKLVGA